MLASPPSYRHVSHVDHALQVARPSDPNILRASAVQRLANPAIVTANQLYYYNQSSSQEGLGSPNGEGWFGRAGTEAQFGHFPVRDRNRRIGEVTPALITKGLMYKWIKW